MKTLINDYADDLKDYFFIDKIKDYDICLEAVKGNGFAIDNVPRKHRTYNLCLEAVKNNGRVLKYIPMKHRDYKMCLEAVKQNRHSIIHVPKKYKVKDFYEEIVIENKNIDIMDVIDKTKYGKDGMGGIITKGTMYVGYPRV